MTTNFPASLDTSTELPSDIGINDTLADRVHHQLHNNLSDSVKKIQEVLGSGWGATSVRATLTAQASQIATLETTAVTLANLTGFVFAFGGPTAPTGFLVCDGSSVLKSAYPALWAVIGYYYGGSGANFNLPDLRGRVPVGQVSGVVDADFGLLGYKTDLTNRARAITTPNMPPHSHTGPSHGHPVNFHTQAAGDHQHAFTYVQMRDNDGSALDMYTINNNGGSRTSVAGNHTHHVSGNTDAAGTGPTGSTGGAGSSASAGTGAPPTPFSVLQPYQVVNYIIKT